MGDTQGKTRFITLCDAGCSGCPTIEIQDNQILIKDDFDGQVVLTPAQWKLLMKVAEQEVLEA